MAHKLLLADDSVTIQRVIELTFADEDVQVVAVGDGRQAIERIQADPPDIVLADVDMPEQDGFQVASFIKQDPALSRIPVLLLTGAFEPVDEARVRAAGCDGVLVKPFEPQLVIARVKDLLANSSGEPTDLHVNATTPGVPSGEVPAGIAPADADVAAIEPSVPTTPIDAYLDRLDAALANRVAAAEPPAPAAETWQAPPADWAPPSVETSQPGFGGEPGGDPGMPTAVQQASPGQIAGLSPDIAEAFDRLLASEQGEAPAPEAPGAPMALRAGVAETTASRAAALDAIVDEVTRRVVERLADRALTEQVADIVSGAAERLVREEIERLKALAK